MSNDILALLAELRPECDFTTSANFVEDGLLDSFDVISLVAMLEERFGAMIDALDILPENFSSVDSLVALVEKSGGAF